MTKISIRSILETDAEGIKKLSAQMGYEMDLESIRKQIKTIIEHPDHWAIAAEKDGQVVGYIHGFAAIRLTAPSFLEIGALVVEASERGKGIGRSLVEKLEAEATNFAKIRVRCNTKRVFAHKFYHQLDFTLQKEQKVFEK